MFAHNNTEIDYIRLAVVNARSAQRHLGLKAKQITIVTDQHSYDYAVQSLGKKFLTDSAKYVIIDKDPVFKQRNIRTYRDTINSTQDLSFYNVNRADAYDITPYDETILIDADYLILSNTLNNCWGHHNEIMMNYSWRDVNSEREFDFARVAPAGITMYWATVVYFRKSDYTEHFFEIIKHIRENPEYYAELYRYPGKIFRNDYAFSVAAHMMTGFSDAQFPQLPFCLYKTFDYDDIHSVDREGIVFYLEKPKYKGEYILARWSGVDVHIMNKWAFNRVSEGLLEYTQ